MPDINTEAIEFALTSIELTIQGLVHKLIPVNEVAARLRADAAAIKHQLPHRMVPSQITTPAIDSPQDGE